MIVNDPCRAFAHGKSNIPLSLFMPTNKRRRLWYDCQSTTFAFRDVTIFLSPTSSSLLSSYFFFLSFLIFVFWFEKWINRDWGREKRKNFALCFVSIITCMLRFKIDCSYQNGIRDYVYISQPHSTAPHRRIEFYYYFFLPFIGLIVRFASFERQFIYAYIKILLSFKSVKCATNFYSIAIRAFIVTAKCKSHMVYGSWFQLLCRAIQFFYATHVIYLKTATIATTTTIEWRK